MVDAAATVEPAVLARCLAVLRTAPAGLMTDIDGTISAIAATPTEAVVAVAAKDALGRLARRLALVGVVTGRGAASGEALVGVPDLVYVGNHGLERRERGRGWEHPAALANAAAVTAALEEIAVGAPARGIAEGVVIEDKRLSGSIHYRLTPDPTLAHPVLRDLAAAAAARYGLRVTEGRLVVELRPPLRVNKGTALAELVAERRLRGLVFLGDDLTDVDGFLALRALRQTDGLAALAVGVLAVETPPPVLDAADMTVPGVEACVALLAALADALDRDGAAGGGESDRRPGDRPGSGHVEGGGP